MIDKPVEPHPGGVDPFRNPIEQAREAPVERVFGSNPPIDRTADPAVHLSLVVPTFNESANIGQLLHSLHEVLTATNTTFELIVVDDDSPDQTWAAAAAVAADLPNTRVLRRIGESGLATAVICGWAHARGTVLGVIDGEIGRASCRERV